MKQQPTYVEDKHKEHKADFTGNGGYDGIFPAMLWSENGNCDPVSHNPPLVAALILTHAGQQVFLLHYLIGCDPFKEQKQTILCSDVPVKYWNVMLLSNEVKDVWNLLASREGLWCTWKQGSWCGQSPGLMTLSNRCSPPSSVGPTASGAKPPTGCRWPGTSNKGASVTQLKPFRAAPVPLITQPGVDGRVCKHITSRSVP